MQNPNELTDDELMSVADDPALKAKLTPSEIGRLSSLRSPRIPRDQRGLPMVTSNTSDAPNSPLMDMLGPLAHPQTLTDFARLLTLPVDSVKKALAGAMTMRAAAPAATATAQAVKAAPATATRAVVNGTAAVGDAVGPDVIGVVSPRAGQVVRVAQKVRDARAASAATAAAEAPTVTNNLPNQKLLNELAIAARRAGVKLTEETEQAAIQAVGKGASPAEAVAAIKPSAPVASAPAAPAPEVPVEPPTTAPKATPRPRVPRKAAAPAAETPAEAPVPSAAPAGKIRLSSPETKEFGRLLRQGKSETEAWDLIRSQREMAKRLGLPTAEQARQAVADRNASGRWEDPR